MVSSRPPLIASHGLCSTPVGDSTLPVTCTIPTKHRNNCDAFNQWVFTRLFQNDHICIIDLNRVDLFLSFFFFYEKGMGWG